MSDRHLPDFIHAGAQKAGSTWIYQALQEHPEVYMAEKEPVNYFDINYHRGREWYRGQFDGYMGENVVGDESPGYLKHPLAPERVAEILPDTKVVFCLRNPVERAFSQWWHAESYWTNTHFGRNTHHHATADVFVTPGYYNYHLSRWEEYFDPDQLKVTFFDDFVANNESFIQGIYEYIGVDANFHRRS